MTHLGLDEATLAKACPECPRDRLPLYAAKMTAAWLEFEITDKLERAAFLAQLAHESGDLRWWEEHASGSAYEGRKDLGNVELGDGVRYKGRGPFQLTGRANYRTAGEALGLDLEGTPALASAPDVGFRVAAWYWRNRKCDVPARDGNFERVTRLINGGTTGYAHRLVRYERAKRALGIIT